MIRPAAAGRREALLAEDLALAERLSRMQGQEIGPSDVVRALQKAKVRHVLVGAHAVSAWAGEPRATIDVDVIAARPAQARKALAAAFPDLEVDDQPAIVRFRREGREVIDVIKPASAPIYREALKHTVRTRIEKVQADVPELEMVLALKFAAMASPSRPVQEKYQDAHDFIAIVKRHADVDREKLMALAEIVYAGGGDAIQKLVEDARAGRRLTF